MPAKIAQDIFKTLERLHVVREFEGAFYEATGLKFNLRPLPDDPRVPFVQPDENALCALVCSTVAGRSLCHQTQQSVRRKFEQSAEPQQLQCLAGLTVVAVPVLVNGSPVAILHTNRMRTREPQPQAVARLASRLEEWGCHIAPQVLENSLWNVPAVSPRQVNAVIKLLHIYAEHIGELAGRCLLAEQTGPPSAVSLAMEFVRAHLSEHIHLRDVAQQAKLNPFYFCKLFKKSAGMTFTSYLARTRIEKAKDMLLNPVTRIGNVAFATGFGSITHFNRAFKRYTGLTPTAHRAAMLGESVTHSAPGEAVPEVHATHTNPGRIFAKHSLRLVS